MTDGIQMDKLLLYNLEQEDHKTIVMNFGIVISVVVTLGLLICFYIKDSFDKQDKSWKEYQNKNK